ncbi:APC family permease [Nocardioides sp. NPDC051685]|uniref:APC family permease n=1 Tax=Nocardioides sp. NPDC051685 TaxID=3364334 RepID=UPI0037B1CF86
MSADDTRAVSEEGAVPGASSTQRLKPNAVGLIGVLFMAVATAAPITAMVGNVPIAIGFGNGSHAPAGYLVATIVLSLFSLGYSAMAKHITATGAFYGFISYGLGRIVGMGAGALTTLAYVVFEASLVGIFAFFAKTFASAHLGLEVSWIWFALLMLAVNALLTYFDINLAAKVLGLFLVAEILMLGLMTLTVLFSGGGPDGWTLDSLNPIAAFQNLSANVTGPDGKTIAATGSAGIGLFFAFWSWVGFESTAMYGEESREPKKMIPKAIMLSVVGIGLFYVIVSWSAIVGTGPDRAIALAQDSATAGQIFFGPVEQHLGHWAVVMFDFLLMTGSYACGMAFHNCAARYIYAIGREDLVPGFGKTIGATHPVHGSPHVAGFVQTAIATAIVGWFFLTGRDPYGQLYALMAILGTTAILIVQALAAFSSIAFFHVGKDRPSGAHWFRTFIAPLIGGIGMLYVIWLLIQNAGFAAGAASSDIVFKLTPWIVGAVGIGGVLFALWCRQFSSERYEIIGRVVLDDVQVREE